MHSIAFVQSEDSKQFLGIWTCREWRTVFKAEVLYRINADGFRCLAFGEAAACYKEHQSACMLRHCLPMTNRKSCDWSTVAACQQNIETSYQSSLPCTKFCKAATSEPQLRCYHQYPKDHQTLGNFAQELSTGSSISIPQQIAAEQPLATDLLGRLRVRSMDLGMQALEHVRKTQEAEESANMIRCTGRLVGGDCSIGSNTSRQAKGRISLLASKFLPIVDIAFGFYYRHFPY